MPILTSGKQCLAFKDNSNIMNTKIQCKNHKVESDKLLDTIRETTGIHDLEFDNEGDICIGWGTARMVIRLIENPPYVRVYSIILKEVNINYELLTRLNSLNKNGTLMRFFYRKNDIYACSDVAYSGEREH